MAKDDDSRRNLPEVNGFKIERRQNGQDMMIDEMWKMGERSRRKERELVLEKLSIILIFLQGINLINAARSHLCQVLQKALDNCSCHLHRAASPLGSSSPN